MAKRSLMKSPADPKPGSACLSLRELCIRSAIDNLDLIGDVGGLDGQFLDILLPHCTAEQLWSIEEATEGRDLSPITDDLWMKCYRRKFGEESVNAAVAVMARKQRTFKWKALYQAKLKEQEEVAKDAIKSLTAKCRAAVKQKATRQLQQIDKAPPPSSKRKGGISSSSGYGMGLTPPSGVKGRLMKKSKMDCKAFNEARRTAPPPKREFYANYVVASREKEDARRKAVSQREEVSTRLDLARHEREARLAFLQEKGHGRAVR